MEGLYIGTSGWVYKGWAGAFYPKGMKPAEQLPYYASHFPTVEINATFYRLPGENMVRAGMIKRRRASFTLSKAADSSRR